MATSQCKRTWRLAYYTWRVIGWSLAVCFSRFLTSFPQDAIIADRQLWLFFLWFTCSSRPITITYQKYKASLYTWIPRQDTRLQSCIHHATHIKGHQHNRAALLHCPCSYLGHIIRANGHFMMMELIRCTKVGHLRWWYISPWHRINPNDNIHAHCCNPRLLLASRSLKWRHLQLYR